jgi:DNA-binding transcriptional MerR regulator/uncharacterized protein (DUF433 family)
VSVSRMPARGHYLAHEVGRLAGVSGDRIGQWARRGYIRSSQSTGRPRVYSFQDVAEAMVVHELIQNEVPLREIKRAIQGLYDEYGDWPLTDADLHVADFRRLDVAPEGRARRRSASVVVVKEDAAFYDAGRGDRWQQVLEPRRIKRIASELRRGGWAVREAPDLRHIEVDPDLLSGTPAVKGSRIAAEFAGSMAQAPAGERLLRLEYGLTKAQIADAKRWWQVVSAFEADAA